MAKRIIYTPKKVVVKKIKGLNLIDFIKVVSTYYYQKIKRKKKFKYKGAQYNYHFKRRDGSWESERTIELPIIWELIKKNSWRRILEVGNVLSYYYKTIHEVLDKYEIKKGVINEDVVDFKPKNKYDLIVSISTIEHIGFNEETKDKKKVLKAIKKLKNMLKNNGKIVITIPWGYNPHLDDYIKKGLIKFDEKVFFKRISKNNEWVQIKEREFMKTRYNNPFPYANGLLIGTIKKPL